MAIKQNGGSEVLRNSPGLAATFHSFWNDCSAPKLHPGLTSLELLWTLGHLCVPVAQALLCGFLLFTGARCITQPCPAEHYKSHCIFKKKKIDSLELLQFTFFLGMHNLFWCLSIHPYLACLPRSCLGFGDVSSPCSLLQKLPTPFGVQKIREPHKMARYQETRTLLSAQHLIQEPRLPLRVSMSWGRIPGRCVALE